MMEVLKSTWSGLGALLLPVVILGGIYGGIFTPTEAAAVGVVYSLLVGGLVYRELKLKELPQILINTMITSAIRLPTRINSGIASSGKESKPVTIRWATRTNGFILVTARNVIVDKPIEKATGTPRKIRRNINKNIIPAVIVFPPFPEFP
jgi:hypothetical protein